MKVLPITDEKELLLRLRDGDQRAFQQIFHIYYRRLCVYAERYTHQQEEVEDIVNDVFLHLWNSPKTFTSLEHLKASLYVSTKHTGINHYNSALTAMKRNYTFSEEYEDIENDYLLHITRVEALNELYTALAGLPEKAGKIILETYIEGKSNQEVADEMGISVQTVKNQKHRALTILRSQLKPDSFELLFACYLAAASSNL